MVPIQGPCELTPRPRLMITVIQGINLVARTVLIPTNINKNAGAGVRRMWFHIIREHVGEDNVDGDNTVLL